MRADQDVLCPSMRSRPQQHALHELCIRRVRNPQSGGPPPFRLLLALLTPLRAGLRNASCTRQLALLRGHLSLSGGSRSSCSTPPRVTRRTRDRRNCGLSCPQAQGTLLDYLWMLCHRHPALSILLTTRAPNLCDAECLRLRSTRHLTRTTWLSRILWPNHLLAKSPSTRTA
jgi:hypothetical protein